MLAIIYVLGPTCCGKSDVGIAIATEADGEIISADSMQVYRGFDIGTAKLPPGERGGIPHHMIDCCDPVETFSAGEFQARADRLIGEISGRGRLPIVVGGTGLYLRALLLGLAAVGPADAAVRERLRRRAGRNGIAAAHRLLRRLDPPTARRLPPGDGQRILRALEYRVRTGRRLSDAISRRPFGAERYEALKIGLRIERGELRRRIDRRVDSMFAQGWIEEVEALLAAGCPPDAQAFAAIGYRDIIKYLNKEVTLEQAKESIKKATHQFLKRQETWFRSERNVNWVDASSPRTARDEAINLAKELGAGRAGG